MKNPAPAPLDSPPTIRDVARLSGVSVGSASRALKNQPGIAEPTRQRIVQTAQQLGYDFGNLKRNKMRRVSFLLHRHHSTLMDNAFYSEVLHGAEDACREANLSLSFSSVDSSKSIEDLLNRHEAEALLLVGYFEASVLERLSRAQIPAVLVDHWAPHFVTINSDNFGGSYLLTQRLIRSGRTRIAFMAGSLSHYSIAQRQLGYRQAHWHAGLTLDPALEVSRDPPELEEGAYKAMRNLLEQTPPPDAVVCYNDSTARYVMQACRDANVKIPQDIAVVGFDDIRDAAQTRPALTTVQVDKQALGREGIRALLALQQGFEVSQIIVPVKPIFRSSD